MRTVQELEEEIKVLKETVAVLIKRIDQLETENMNLKAENLKLKTKSDKSNKPPSSDGYSKKGYVRQWRNMVSIFNPNSKILITNPITISCIKTDLEKQMVFRHSLFMSVLKVRFLRFILWVFALPITWFSGCILRS